MIKKRNRVYRRIAVALTVALLAGQSHAFVLAEEGDTPQTEITGEADMSTPDSDSDLDNDSTPDGGNDSQNPDDNGNQGDGNGQDKCICGTKCTADVVNTDCPVCAENYEACAGQADDAGNDDLENGDPENNDSDPENGGQDNQDGSAEGIADGQKCVCETSCTEEAVNADCPVCAADYANCAKNAGGGVNLSADAVLLEMALASVMDEEAGIAALADEGVEAYAEGDMFTYTYEGQTLRYYVNKEDGDTREVAVISNNNAVSGDVTIPESLMKGSVTYRVTRIEAYAFDQYGNLSSIKIPNSVTSIGEHAFEECSSLSSIEIPDSVTSIGEYAFANCNGLTSVKIPNSVTSIGKSVFADCRSLTSVGGTGSGASVEIPDSVTSIGDGAFACCNGLTSVKVPNSVTSIGDSAFLECSSLTSVGGTGSGASVEIPDSVTNIEPRVFQGCINLSSIEIPDSVTSIGENAFDYCINLSSIEIPNSVTSIGSTAFWRCSSLESVKILGSVTGIEAATFADCSSLSSIEIPNSVTSIGPWAFYNCNNLDTLQIVISSNQKYQFPTVGQDAFTGLPDSKVRNDIIIKKGTGLTDDDLKAADVASAFNEAEGADGLNDSLWYGWSYKGLPEVKDTHKVTITVQKDGTQWTDHGRTFALTKDGGTTLVTNLDAVEAGNYEIVDVTDSGNKLNTGVTVTVADADVPSTDPVNYYTVAFCYLDDDGNEQTYGDSTDWKPQTILKTVGRVAEPVTNPTKADHTFDKWITARGGNDAFAFGTTPITAAGTKIYAKWTQTTVPTHKVTITVQKDDAPWTHNDRTFALTKDGGTTLVTNLDAVEAGNYEIYDVTDSGKKLDTGVTVTVADTDVSSDPVEYYTVAFCYLDDDGNEQTYGDSTDWKPQTILKTVGRVTKPATNPTKADHTFDKWVTASNGETAFAFETTPITAKDTKIYAKWTENTVTTYHTVTFYDGDVPYGADTPQRPQRVADGQMADEPEAPQKAGWEFAGWKTTDGGSTPYDFDTPVTGDISIYASWVEKTVVDSLRIQATATEGGTIAPKGEIIVSKGGERTFTITPDEGNKIKAVTVDGKDVTAELKETRARAQTGARYYTFTNIVQNHTIHAEFERDGGSSGGGGGGDNPDPSGDNPGGGDNPNPGGGSGGGGGDNPDPGNDDDNKKPGSGGGNAGGGDNGGGNTNSGGGNNGGGTNPDGGNGAGNTANADTGNGAGNGQTVTGTAVSSAQAGSGAAAASAGSNTAFDGSKAAGGSTSGVAGTAANGKEPKTGDASYLEVYATLAMIAGLTYLLLYVMEESRGMSEREKEAFVAAFIRWGKKGGAFRKCCAMAAIFCLLAYYHIIGKNVGENALREKHLGQAF